MNENSPTIDACIGKAVDALLEARDEVELNDVADYIIEHYPAEFSAYRDQLSRDGLKRKARFVLKAREDEALGPRQLELPRVQFQRAYALKRSDGTYYYKSTFRMRWDDLVNARVVLQHNLDFCQARLKEFDKSVDAIHAYFVKHPKATVAQALEALRRQVA